MALPAMHRVSTCLAQPETKSGMINFAKLDGSPGPMMVTLDFDNLLALGIAAMGLAATLGRVDGQSLGLNVHSTRLGVSQSGHYALEQTLDGDLKLPSLLTLEQLATLRDQIDAILPAAGVHSN